MKSNRTGLLAPFPWLAALVAVIAIGLMAVAPAAQAAPANAVAGTLTWGVVESFRDYVTGPVAQGEITTTDGATTTDDGPFEFPLESGTYDSATGAVVASFGGTVTFEGHDMGAGPLLLLTIGDLRLALEGETGSLVANISSKDMTTGATVQFPNVILVDLAGAEAVGSGTPVTWTGVATSLTAAAAPAFGAQYPAGTAMDPLSLMLIVPPTSATTTPSATVTTTPPSGAPPSVQLSKTVVNPDGDTITVTGSGFIPELAVGTRPPLAGKPAGVYVAFGAFAGNWKPSAGAPSSARPAYSQSEGGLRWAVLEADRAIVGVSDSVTLNPDGTFTATITVKRGYDGALAGGNYGIYTYPGSGAVQPLFETFTAVTFSGDSASPTATATSTVTAPQPPATGTGLAEGGADSRWLMAAVFAAVTVGGAATAVSVRRLPGHRRHE